MNKEENIQNKNTAIKSVSLEEGILTITAIMPIRKFIRDSKKFLNTEMMLSYIESEYQVLDTLEQSKISNWEKPGYSRQGTWKFKIKVTKKRTRRKSGFRDRITNIAKNSEKKVSKSD